LVFLIHTELRCTVNLTSVTFLFCIHKCQYHLYNHHCRIKAISSTYSERMSVALIMKRAKRMRRIILSTVLCPAVPYFSTLSHKRHDFNKNIIDHEMSFDFRYSFCLKSFSFQEKLSELLPWMCIGLQVKYPLFPSYLIILEFFIDGFSKNIQMSNFMKICPVGVELFHADRRTWRS